MKPCGRCQAPTFATRVHDALVRICSHCGFTQVSPDDRQKVRLRKERAA